MDDKRTESIQANLDRLNSSGMSPENTRTCPDRFCKCGDRLKGIWVDQAVFNGKVYQGEGWAFEDLCEKCKRNMEARIVVYDPAKHEELLTKKLTDIFGGDRPAREFTLARFEHDLENSDAYKAAESFNPHSDNLFLFGPCGVGKTHLACAIVRLAVQRGSTAIVMKPSRLTRYMRVKESDTQEARLRELATAGVLVIDELGIGSETAFARQILQEIIDMRTDNYRNGLIITSNYSLEEYASKLGEDPIPSRLAKICQPIKVGGKDHRITKRPAKKSATVHPVPKSGPPEVWKPL
jgi:DNA replication protein DnaC